MSPLLTARPSVNVTLRLLAACVVTAGIAVFVAVASADTRGGAAAPACLAVGCTCAALAAHMLFASSRATADGRLAWLSAGVTVGLAGLLTTLFAQSSLFPNGAPISQSPDAGAARYVIWHLAIVASGAIALAGARPRPRALLAFGATGILLLAWASVVDSPFGNLAASDRYTPILRTLVGLLVAAQVAVAVVWWRRSRGAPSWGELCVLALLGLGALDMLAYVIATQPLSGAWWASLALRAGQFAIPAVGLLVGFIAVAERLRDFQDELAGNLLAERELARQHAERVTLDQRRRDRVRARMQRLIGGEGLDVAFQPIVDLSTGEVVGAEALARFWGEDGEAIPTERCFLDAHAVDAGVELELAVVRLALSCEHRLPAGRYLALNVSPALLEHHGLLGEILAHAIDRPLVVEITEHQPVEDYAALGAALDRLRALGIRVAVDDVGSGFASFRHVTHVSPDILKLDRTLVCGIDDDPVRQSLASAIVAFARDVGATVVSEGIESQSEMYCLKDLEVGCGQGFYLARPNLGAVETHFAELSAVA
jgi:EAL domain-containing protein (putative c-di-GMP-specific phosphodiesterase class I)